MKALCKAPLPPPPPPPPPPGGGGGEGTRGSGAGGGWAPSSPLGGGGGGGGGPGGGGGAVCKGVRVAPLPQPSPPIGERETECRRCIRKNVFQYFVLGMELGPS